MLGRLAEFPHIAGDYDDSIRRSRVELVDDFGITAICEDKWRKEEIRNRVRQASEVIQHHSLRQNQKRVNAVVDGVLLQVLPRFFDQ